MNGEKKGCMSELMKSDCDEIDNKIMPNYLFIDIQSISLSKNSITEFPTQMWGKNMPLKLRTMVYDEIPTDHAS